MSQTINLGSVTAYASAKEAGYTGTYAEFCNTIANFATIADDISEAIEDKADLTNIATVETTTTASKAYAVRDLLIYDGQLYKVTAAISRGGTITPGTNVTTTTISDNIGNSNYFTVDNDGYLCQTINE